MRHKNKLLQPPHLYSVTITIIPSKTNTTANYQYYNGILEAVTFKQKNTHSTG